MNTPALETERLILRKFTKNDIEALFLILKDEEVNKFLPWYPVKSLEETKKFYEERYASKYVQSQGYAYAICLKENDFPVGYIKVDMEEHHDFGYGQRKEFWQKGIVIEAGKAVVEQVKKDGLQWQPKDFPVIFRMYQLNLDGNADFVYRKYWNESENHFVEQL